MGSKIYPFSDMCKFFVKIIPISVKYFLLADFMRDTVGFFFVTFFFCACLAKKKVSRAVENLI